MTVARAVSGRPNAPAEAERPDVVAPAVIARLGEDGS